MARRKDWQEQPSEGVSTTTELYLRNTEEEDSEDEEDRDCLALQIGDDLPEFVAESTQGEIDFSSLSENTWTLVVYFASNYDPVATFFKPAFRIARARAEKRPRPLS